MYCSKCGVKIPEGARFCPNCGEKIPAKTDSEFIKVNITPNVSKENQRISQKETWIDELKKRLQSIWSNLDGFSRLTTVAVMVSTLLCLVSFLHEKIFAGTVSILQIGLLIASYLIYRNIIKTEKKWMHVLLTSIALFLLIPHFILFRLDIENNIAFQGMNDERTAEEFQWPESKLAKMIPVPESNMGYIFQNDSNGFSIYVENVTQEDYEHYVAACAERGFVIDISEDVDFYNANDEGGYRLSLIHETRNAMTIEIKEPSFFVAIELDCTPNLIFNKYDMELYVDGNMIGTLTHGRQDIFEIELEKGTYELEITKKGDTSVSGKAAFDVSNTIKVSYGLYCHADKIDINEEYIESLVPLTEKQAKIPASSDDYKDQICGTVLDELSKAGFTNIVIKAIEDLKGGWLDIDGKIETISIGGRTEFRKAEIFDKDVEITITYHTLMKETEEAVPESKETEESTGLAISSVEMVDSIIDQLSPYKGKTVAELIPVLAEMGYTATYTAENTGMDFTYSVQNDAPTQEVFVVTDFQNIDVNSQTVEVMMLGKDTISDREKRKTTQDRLEEKLDELAAWKAVEAYGKMQYSSFKLHYIGGKLEARAMDEDTWFLKALCDVKTPAGQVKNLNCEAKVTGTTGRPVVTYFIVY